jgi:FkbM family methyltransferase
VVRWRRALSAHVARILSRLDINCVLDVGANVGQFGRQIRAAGYAGRIVSFEPLPTFACQLRQVACHDADWRVFEYALGDTDTEMDINARPGSMSSLLPSSDFGRRWHPRLTVGRKERVRVRRLDSLYDTAIAGLNPPRVFLKLDTQGYDLWAFAGAGERVREILGLQAELSCVPIYEGMPRLPEQIAVYENAGFEITGMFPVNDDPDSLRVIEFDVVMVRPGAVSSP